MINNFTSLSTKDKIFIVLSYIYILFIIFPLFGDLTHIHESVPALVLVVFVALAYPDVFKKKPVAWALTYVGMLMLYTIVGRGIHINGVASDATSPWWQITIEVAWTLPALLVASVLELKRDMRLFRIVGIGPIVLLAISFIYILPLINASSNILREDVSNEMIARPLGLPDYALMHAYTLMLVALFFALGRYSRERKLLVGALILLFVYIVMRTSVTTSLFVIIFTAIFALVYNEHSKTKTAVALILVGCALYTFYLFGGFLWVVDSLMPFFEGTAVHLKLEDMHQSLTSGALQGGSITGRMDLHEISRNSFFHNPIIGSEKVGGHSKVLDMLGMSGLLMFVPYAMMIWTMLRWQMKVAIDQRSKAFIAFAYFAAFVYLYEKGIFGSPGFLFMFVLVPSAIMAMGKRKLI